MTARLLLIALDGADSNLLDRWSLDGTLPEIGRLRATGTTQHLDAPHGITDDGLWASFQYAQGLGEHGRFDYRQRLSTGKVGMAIREEGDRLRFWDRLSESGKRVAVLDIPKTAGPRPLNGIHLCDWLVHGRNFRTPRSYPESLAEEIVATFGAAPPSQCDYIVDLDEAVRKEAAANIVSSVDQKRRAGLHYLQSEHWDLFAISFKETHCAGHNFWDLSDPLHPDYDEALRDRLGDPIRTVFQKIDKAVGDLVVAAGPDAKVILLSTTKMEPNGSIRHFHRLLQRRLNRRIAGEGLLPRFVRQMRKTLPPVEIMHYTENGTAIRINRPSPERDRLKEAVARELMELTAEGSTEPVASKVYFPSVEYAGPRAAQLPDVLVRYRAGCVPSEIGNTRLGRLTAEVPTYRPGNHACGPFVIARGTDATPVRAVEDFGALCERALA